MISRTIGRESNLPPFCCPLDSLNRILKNKDVAGLRKLIGNSLSGGMQEGIGTLISGSLERLSDEQIMGALSQRSQLIQQMKGEEAYKDLSPAELEEKANQLILQQLMYECATATASGMATHGVGALMAGLNAWQDGKNQPVESFGEKEQETWEKVTREESIAQAGLDNEEIIGKGVGAKRANNLLIEDKSTGEEFYLVPGTRLQNKEVFAGMNGKDPLHEGVAEGLADEFGGEIDKWQHIKAIGTIDYYGEERKANVHWFENPTVPGRHKGKVKEWLD